MSKIEMLNLAAEKVKEIKLNDNVWGIKPNDPVLHNSLILAMANARRATASTKTRDEIRGGGRKPWRQKGTGNARQGSIRAPQWRGGGVVFGPTPNRNYSKKQNKKELVVVAELDENVCLASRNLANVKVVTFNEVNTYDTVNADNMIITSEALQKLEEVLTNE